MDFEELITAGEITRKIKKEVPKIVYVDANLLDIAETIENMIEEEGAQPAFPVNISINEIAAHYTPSLKEERTVKEDDLIKVDFGLYYNGFITDNAITVDLSGKYKDMVDAAESALKKAISSMKAGVSNGYISEIIEKEIKSRGFKPIANLSGHKIEGENLHAGIDIPNISTKGTYTFKEGDVFAIEPFVTTSDAAGYVVELNEVEIYSIIAPMNLRMRESRKIFSFVYENYGPLPFAERWIKKKFGSSLLINAALKELLKTHSFKAYPVLVEKTGKPVAQAEHTVLVKEDHVEVIT